MFIQKARILLIFSIKTFAFRNTIMEIFLNLVGGDINMKIFNWLFKQLRYSLDIPQ